MDMELLVTEDCWYKKSYNWKIPHFLALESNVASEIFTVLGNEKTQWQLLCNPAKDDYTALYIKLISSTKPEVAVTFTLSLLNKAGAKIHHGTETQMTFSIDKQQKRNFWAADYYILRANVIKTTNGKRLMLPYGSLIVLFELNVHEGNENESVASFANAVSELCGSYNDMFDNRTFSDITLVVGENEVKVHKAILATRSRVFEAMLQNSEVVDRLEITDVEYTILIEMLRFMYTGSATGIQSPAIAKRLFLAAEKYKLNTLKEMCAKFIKNQLTVDNAFDILIMADSYCCGYLKDGALDFITDNIGDVVETDGFVELKNGKLELLKEVFLKLGE